MSPSFILAMFILSLLATWVVSLLTRPPADVDEMFEAMERRPNGDPA